MILQRKNFKSYIHFKGQYINNQRESGISMLIAQHDDDDDDIKNFTSTPQSSSCIATNHQSRKLLKLDEPGMRDTAEKVGTSS